MSLFLQMLVLRGVCSILANPVSTGFAMSKTAITSPALTPPVGPFSQAIQIDGFLFFSGQVAQDPAMARWSRGHCARDGARLPKLSAVLKAASKSLDDVVRRGVFLTNMTDFAAMNGIYAKIFQSALSRPHDDRGCRATTWGLRRDRSRCQGLRRRMEVDLMKYAFQIVDFFIRRYG